MQRQERGDTFCDIALDEINEAEFMIKVEDYNSARGSKGAKQASFMTNNPQTEIHNANHRPPSEISDDLDMFRV